MNPDLTHQVREAAAGDESAVAWLDAMMPDWREAMAGRGGLLADSAPTPPRLSPAGRRWPLGQMRQLL